MKRTIKTPHDVVQILIDIIVSHEYKIDIFTQYFCRTDSVKVIINTFYFVYICLYETTGNRVEFRRYKKKFSSSSKILVACTFRVHGEHTDYISVYDHAEKISIICL